jgi:pimeloyl-ACP methyl ester carboxylesterase
MGFDPANQRVAQTMLHHHMVGAATFNCLLIAGSDRRTSGAASVVTAEDVAMLQAANPNLLVAQRVPGTGHAVLLDNPDGARMALQTYIVDRTIDQ